MKKDVICLFVLAGIVMACGSVWAYPARQISQYGITWTFDREYECGQFVNGDYWVVGPVNIISINPASSGGRNGSMINPVVVAGQAQGYDSRAHGYVSSLNVAIGVSSGSPLNLKTGESLVSTISRSSADRTALQTAAALSCLSGPVSSTAFRPPFCGRIKPLFDSARMRRDLLVSVPLTGGSRKENNPVRYFQRPHLTHGVAHMGESIRPVDNCKGYYRDAHLRESEAALLLCGRNSDVPYKEELLINFVQLGIDHYYTIQTRPNPTSRGCRCMSKWPIIFAGIMLDNEDMRSKINYRDPAYGYEHFKSEGMTYFGDAQHQLWSGWQNSGHPYAANVMWRQNKGGNPAGGEYEHIRPSQWNSAQQKGERYRHCCHSWTWVGTALAARLMGAVEIWNHDPFFAYIDRWMYEPDPNPGISGIFVKQGTGGSSFVDNMWDRYRATPPPPPPPPPPPSINYGDVSGNGAISAYDASLTAQYAVGSVSLTQEQITRADVTGNGDVSATDASWIARKAVDATVVFPVEELAEDNDRLSIRERQEADLEPLELYTRPEGSFEVAAGQLLEFNVMAVDKDAGSLGLKAENLPAGAKFDVFPPLPTENGQKFISLFEWIPDRGQAQNTPYIVKFIATSRPSDNTEIPEVKELEVKISVLP